MNNAIVLSTLEPFARGGNRACYVDPRDNSRCIKVALPGKTAARKRSKISGFKRFRPLWYYDDNRRELATYQRLEAMNDEELWAALPRCHGMVDTDQGEGIVTDLIRNHDGAISGDLKAKLRQRGKDGQFREALERFIKYLRRTALPTRDLLLHNLVARVENADGHFTICVIDGFGSADMFPLAYWSKRLARQKVERKISKFYVKIDDFCQKYGIAEHDD